MFIFSKLFRNRYSCDAIHDSGTKQPSKLAFNKKEFSSLLSFMSTIPNCTTLKSKDEMQAATKIAELLNLPLHNDKQKNWDTLKSLYYLLQSTESTANVLDAGGGIHSPILNTLALFGYENLYACDVVDVNYNQEQFSNRIKFSIQNIEKTNYPNCFFHAVTCLSVIEHGVDHTKFFNEMSRILVKDGLLIITTDYWPDYIDCSGIYPYGPNNPEMKVYQAYDIEELVGIGSEFGFELCSPLELTVSEKAVRWDNVDREYTFIFVAMKKQDNSICNEFTQGVSEIT